MRIIPKYRDMEEEELRKLILKEQETDLAAQLNAVANATEAGSGSGSGEDINTPNYGEDEVVKAVANESQMCAEENKSGVAGDMPMTTE